MNNLNLSNLNKKTRFLGITVIINILTIIIILYTLYCWFLSNNDVIQFIQKF